MASGGRASAGPQLITAVLTPVVFAQCCMKYELWTVRPPRRQLRTIQQRRLWRTGNKPKGSLDAEMDDASSQGADESERAKLASAAATQSVATLSPFRLRRRGCGCGCAPALFRTGAVRCVDSHSSAKSAKRRARPVGKKRRTKSTARPMPPDPSRPAPSARLRPCPPLPFAPAAAAGAACLPAQDGEASDAAEPDGATPERPQSAQKEAEAAGSESEEDWDAEPAPVRPADSRSSASYRRITRTIGSVCAPAASVAALALRTHAHLRIVKLRAAARFGCC